MLRRGIGGADGPAARGTVVIQPAVALKGLHGLDEARIEDIRALRPRRRGMTEMAEPDPQRTDPRIAVALVQRRAVRNLGPPGIGAQQALQTHLFGQEPGIVGIARRQPGQCGLQRAGAHAGEERRGIEAFRPHRDVGVDTRGRHHAGGEIARIGEIGPDRGKLRRRRRRAGRGLMDAGRVIGRQTLRAAAPERRRQRRRPARTRLAPERPPVARAIEILDARHERRVRARKLGHQGSAKRLRFRRERHLRHGEGRGRHRRGTRHDRGGRVTDRVGGSGNARQRQRQTEKGRRRQRPERKLGTHAERLSGLLLVA